MNKNMIKILQSLKIGELLDAWEQLPNDIKTLEELEEVDKIINYIMAELEE
jgi:hypothetical protein